MSSSWSRAVVFLQNIQSLWGSFLSFSEGTGRKGGKKVSLGIGNLFNLIIKFLTLLSFFLSVSTFFSQRKMLKTVV